MYTYDEEFLPSNSFVQLHNQKITAGNCICHIKTTTSSYSSRKLCRKYIYSHIILATHTTTHTATHIATHTATYTATHTATHTWTARRPAHLVLDVLILECSYVPGLPLSCSWATAVAADSRLVTLFFGRTVFKRICRFVSCCQLVPTTVRCADTRLRVLRFRKRSFSHWTRAACTPPPGLECHAWRNVPSRKLVLQALHNHCCVRYPKAFFIPSAVHGSVVGDGSSSGTRVTITRIFQGWTKPTFTCYSFPYMPMSSAERFPLQYESNTSPWLPVTRIPLVSRDTCCSGSLVTLQPAVIFIIMMFMWV